MLEPQLANAILVIAITAKRFNFIIDDFNYKIISFAKSFA
ncbi:hypothetical protein ADIARSV_3318 [Arcticibacter svalbardensis MN12-7]|uniref:Uncharacterized protein n=1 Tax=Arcticibacter svalbardensis MN12-7 TaxID=1150600 RepID=R9GQ02_9SPHI|nr:hypothetical protein ADIARSV_3318 [Arcticibacter svalbardensis MN12-7]